MTANEARKFVIDNNSAYIYIQARILDALALFESSCEIIIRRDQFVLQDLDDAIEYLSRYDDYEIHTEETPTHEVISIEWY